MKVGDLVKKVNPWTQHNPWMKFPDDEEIGLVTAVTPNQNVAAVLIGGRTEYIEVEELEVVNVEV